MATETLWDDATTEWDDGLGLPNDRTIWDAALEVGGFTLHVLADGWRTLVRADGWRINVRRPRT